jgi:hypothetical protein
MASLEEAVYQNHTRDVGFIHLQSVRLGVGETKVKEMKEKGT